MEPLGLKPVEAGSNALLAGEGAEPRWGDVSRGVWEFSGVWAFSNLGDRIGFESLGFRGVGIQGFGPLVI